MLLRLLLAMLSASVWADPVIQSVSPAQLPVGSESEISMKVLDGTGYQFAIMPGGPYIKQTLPLGYPVSDMVAHRGHGLLAAGEKGLLIADISSSGKIKVSAAYAAHDSVTRVVAERDRVWLVNDGSEVVELDISDPEKPVVLGSYRSKQLIEDIVVQDDYVYLLLGAATIAVIDMRMPQAPMELSRFTLDGEAKKIFVDDNHIYAAQPEYGLAIIDVHDKALPKLIGHHVVNGGATSVAVKNGLVLVARGESGVTLFDVSEPAQAKWLGSHSRVGHVLGIASQANKMLLWNDRDELINVSIGNPELPAITASHKNSDVVAAIWLDDETVLTASTSGLESFDFSVQPPLFSNENLDTGQGVNFGGERRLFLDGNIAYVADWFSGLHLYDISTPSHPLLLSTFHTPGSAKGVIVRDGYAFVADDDHGLQVIDVSDPLLPIHVSSLATNGLAYTPKLVGNLLYLAGHRGGFQIIDVSDVSVPKLIANVDTPGKAWSLEVKDKTLFVADDAAGVLVFDVSDTQHPKQIGVFNPGGAAEDVVVRGDTAYVAFFDAGFYVLNISNPGKPVQIGHTFTSGNARGIALKDDIAYVVDWFAGIQVIDISNKASPAIVGEYDTSGAAWGIGIKDNHAYIGDWWGGFVVLNISDPKNPRQVNRYQAKGKVSKITTQGKFAYAAMNRGGVHIFDITNPLNPTWSSAVEIDGNITGLCIESSLMYVAVGNGRDSGIVIIDVSNPFQAYRIKHLAVEGGIQHIRGGARNLYIGNEQGLGLIALLDPLRVQTWLSLATKITDLWVEQNNIFLATGDGLEVLDDELNTKLHYKTEYPVSMVRAHKDKVYLYGSELGVHVLNMIDGKAVLVSTFNPAESWADMTVQDDVLYAAEFVGNLLTMDVADSSKLKITALYPLTGSASGVAVIDGIALLAGNDIITSVKLFSPVQVTQRDKNKIRMLLPEGLPAGSYDVLAIAPNGNRKISHNVFNIDTPRFSKPEITAEEFKQLLQEQRSKSASGMQAR